MLAYGVCVGSSGSYERRLRPSIPASAEVHERRSQRSIFTAYNSILEEVRGPVALVHDDVALGPQFEQDAAAALSLGAGVVGCIGSRNPPSIEWWAGEQYGRATEGDRVLDFGGGTHEVDTVDGLCMVLSADCARQVRFDDRRYSGFHAYDIDFCYTARQAGFRVLVTPLDLVHHCKGGYGDILAWRRADVTWQRKWHRTPLPVLAARRAKIAVRRFID